MISRSIFSNLRTTPKVQGREMNQGWLMRKLTTLFIISDKFLAVQVIALRVG
ncbi:MAG: hypothetical protein KME49_03850 [Brasilonema octagenarum HA4186-MV1]|jgi:hypothetical protein|uniref:hypothetical protein n=1 Tax=Brasilonema TaxID=383614 RepID=UPI00145C5E2B|nr:MULTISPECIES: hypothetical protein [Brasilonema]MBW4624656.1 hypothetical protein [Brasilonema octagenarum HA4186-MV1]